MSEKGQLRKSMLPAPKNVDDLRRLYDSDYGSTEYAFTSRMAEGWRPEHSHMRGQLLTLTRGAHRGSRK